MSKEIDFHIKDCFRATHDGSDEDFESDYEEMKQTLWFKIFTTELKKKFKSFKQEILKSK